MRECPPALHPDWLPDSRPRSGRSSRHGWARSLLASTQSAPDGQSSFVDVPSFLPLAELGLWSGSE